MLPDSIAEGVKWTISSDYPVTANGGEIIAIDQTMSVQGRTYNSVVVVRETSGPGYQPYYQLTRKTYYAKNVGVIHCEYFNPMDSTEMTGWEELTDYHVNH